MRRVMLRLGGVGLLLSLPTEVDARDPSYELDAEVYAGQSHGAWTCGPRATARYGGAGARLRLSERARRAEEGAGFHGTLGGAAEYELVDITDCREAPSCEKPPDHAMFGAGIAGGYRARPFGISLGVLAYQAWGNDESSTPDWVFFPALELAFGRERSFEWLLGLGAPAISTYRHPAVVYTGPRYTSRRWELELLGGLYRAGPSPLDTLHLRFDAAAAFSISENLSMGPHGAIALEGRPVDHQLGLRVWLGL